MHFLLYLGDLVTLVQEQEIGSVSDNSGKLVFANVCIQHLLH